MENLNDDRGLERVISESKPSITAKAKGAILVGMGLSVLATVGAIKLHQVGREAEAAFVENLQSNPLEGTIAYSVDREIRLLEASNLLNQKGNIKRFQISGDIEKLLWVDDSSLVYSVSGTLEMPSDRLYLLDVNSGRETLVFSPYSEQSRTLLGDIIGFEETMREEKNKFIEDAEGKSGLHVWHAEMAGASIKDLAVSSNSNDIYMKIGDNWYRTGQDGSGFEKPTIIPSSLVSSQLESKDGKYKVVDDFFVPPRIVNKSRVGIYLEDDADEVAWYSGE